MWELGIRCLSLSALRSLRSTGAITWQHLGCKGIDLALRVYTGPQQTRVASSYYRSRGNSNKWPRGATFWHTYLLISYSKYHASLATLPNSQSGIRFSLIPLSDIISLTNGHLLSVPTLSTFTPTRQRENRPRGVYHQEVEGEGRRSQWMPNLK